MSQRISSQLSSTMPPVSPELALYAQLQRKSQGIRTLSGQLSLAYVEGNQNWDANLFATNSFVGCQGSRLTSHFCARSHVNVSRKGADCLHNGSELHTIGTGFALFYQGTCSVLGSTICLLTSHPSKHHYPLIHPKGTRLACTILRILGSWMNWRRMTRPALKGRLLLYTGDLFIIDQY